MRLLFVLFSLIVFNSSFATGDGMKAELEKKFPYQKILGIRKTPYLGLYEVDFEDQVVYVDEKLTYIFSGNIIEMRSLKNLTEEQERKLYAVRFDAFPLKLAIRNVKGSGKNRLAVFSDPNCSYCKKLEKEMAGLTDATIYIFPIAILPGSDEMTKVIWCSDDKLKAWDDHMLEGVEPKQGKRCDTSGLDRIARFAKKLGITVTPTIIFEDGSTNPGWLSLGKMENHFLR